MIFLLKGELIREEGLFKNLWYASFFESTISLIIG